MKVPAVSGATIPNLSGGFEIEEKIFHPSSLHAQAEHPVKGSAFTAHTARLLTGRHSPKDQLRVLLGQL
ncbi:MAG TPA: hypothetical protein VK208_01205 [Pyrinomonadaceae bacterium]|jgi:hypothetical protein|nr:hypothetical protein [Pyrinomonadaceae bacterium]